MDPLTFIERLAARVPRPFVRLVTYHGLFAPAAPLRDRVVPPPEEDVTTAARHSCPISQTDTYGKSRKPRRKRYAWAELLRRVFLFDALLCDACGGRRRLLAFITDVGSIRSILTHLGLPPLPPPCSPARPPPMQPLPFA